MRTYSVSLTEDAESDIAELMAFYDELVDEESATKFFEEAMATISKLQEFPHANSSLKEYPEAHRVRMENHKVAIVYIIDDYHYEVVAVRAYHQMQNPVEYQESIRERIRRLTDS